MRGDFAWIEPLYLELEETQSIVHPEVSFGVWEFGMPDDWAIADFYRDFCHFLLRKLIFSISCVKIIDFWDKYIFCVPSASTKSRSRRGCLQSLIKRIAVSDASLPTPEDCLTEVSGERAWECFLPMFSEPLS